MISAATTVHQDARGAEVWHSPQPQGRRHPRSTVVHGGRSVGHPGRGTRSRSALPLLPTRRLLLEGEKPVRLGSRALTSSSLWSSAPASWSAKTS